MWSTSAGSGARLRASTAAYSASEPLRVQSVSTEHPLADGQAGGSVPQLGDDTRQLVAGHTRRPVAARAIGPRSRPVELSGGEPRGMHLHDDVVLSGVRVWHFGQGKPSHTGVAVSDGDGSHGTNLSAV